MSESSPESPWRQKIWHGLLIILAVAIGTRIAADMLAPVLPTLIAIVCVGVLARLVIRR